MKLIKIIGLSSIAAGIMISCQNDEIEAVPQTETSIELSKNHIQGLIDAGLNPTDAFYTTQTNLAGESVEGIQIMDIFMALDQLASQALANNKDGTKQFRTNNLVSGANRTIDILGFTRNDFALTSKMRTALQWAVNNYNRLGNSLNFRLTYGTNFQAADMVVYNNNQRGGGGSAGFPSGGRPFKFVQINQGTDAFSTNVIEHVITHEIGHSVGFRHQDWRTRQSCGSNQNEGTAGVGAIRIGNTPTSDRADSIMLACFGNGEDGEFSSTDINALNILY